MEDGSSGSDGALLARMRALARRGAELHKIADGTAMIEQADARRPAQRVSPDEFLRWLDAGWIRSSGMDKFVISRRGMSALRTMLSRPADSAGRRSEPVGTPTAEDEQCTASAQASAKPALNVKESPLAWLAQRRDAAGKPLVSREQVEAGERLRVDFEFGNMGPRVTASWNPASVPSRGSRSAPGVGIDMTDRAVAARQRVEAALKAVGPELSGVLIDVCCFLKGIEQAERNGGWPRRSGKVVLQLALSHLGRHYGIERREAREGERLRIWHADDWNPAPGRKKSDPPEDVD